MSFTIRVQAIKGKPWDAKGTVKEINAALEATGKILDRGFAPTVESWEGEKPTFKHTTGGVGSSGGRAFVHSFPSGSKEGVEKWVRLDEGAPAHVIVARNAPFLVFPFQGRGKSHVPKTTVGHLVSHPGTKFGPTRRFKSVNHPGHEARGWSVVLAEQEIGPFAARIQTAIAIGLGG